MNACYDKKDFLEKGYELSQCFLLRLGGMYVKRGGNEWLNWIYVVYYLSVFGLFVFILVPYSVAVAVPIGHTFALFEGLHFWIVIFGHTCTNVMYQFNRKSIDNALIIIGQGFYTYEGEEAEEDIDATKIVKSNQEFMKKLTKFMIPNVFGVGTFVVILPPIVELINYGGAMEEDAILNPYLPLPVFTIWDQFTIIGYISMYILIIICTLCVVLELLALSLGYSSFMVLYVTQYSLLNNSIKKMEHRATRRFQRTTKNIDEKGKFNNPFFHECMNFCLKQNIQHHQILLRWMREAERFLGWALLCTFLATSILLATTGYLFIVSNNSIIGLITLVQVIILELVHSYLFCWWGETLASESARIPIILYNVPWIYCDQKFKKSLHIMLSKVQHPVVPHDPLFKIKASLETYGSMVSSAYTYFNLMRSAN